MKFLKLIRQQQFNGLANHLRFPVTELGFGRGVKVADLPFAVAYNNTYSSMVK